MPLAATDNRLRADFSKAREHMYRDLLVSAGEEIFARYGYDAAHMQDIAAAAGVSLKTVYNYFPGKRELYQEIKSVRGQALLAEVEGVMTGLAARFAKAPLPTILEGMETHLRFFMTHPGYLNIHLLEGYAWFDSQARTGQEELWQRGRLVIEQLFKFGIEAGLFVPQPPNQLLAHLISLQQTRLATWVADGMQQPIDDVIDVAKAEFVRFFCVPAMANRVLVPDGSRLRERIEQ